MRRIRLTGKHAVGDRQYAIVDDELFDVLSRYAWKAKPNAAGNNVYAVRNVARPEGGHQMLRMHRVVLGYDGPLDVDHINRNPLDNRRENLRAVTRSVNAKNTDLHSLSGSCLHCGSAFHAAKPICVRAVLYCSEHCKDAAARQRARQRSESERYKVCGRCGSGYLARKVVQRFCSERCRKAAKYARQKEAGQGSRFSPAPDRAGAMTPDSVVAPEQHYVRPNDH